MSMPIKLMFHDMLVKARIRQKLSVVCLYGKVGTPGYQLVKYVLVCVASSGRVAILGAQGRF